MEVPRYGAKADRNALETREQARTSFASRYTETLKRTSGRRRGCRICGMLSMSMSMTIMRKVRKGSRKRVREERESEEEKEEMDEERKATNLSM